MGLVKETQNILFKVGTNLNVGLVQKGAGASRGDTVRNLPRDPRILARVTDEDDPCILRLPTHPVLPMIYWLGMANKR